MYTLYKLVVIGAYIAQPFILKRMKRRRMERDVVREAEQITFEDSLFR